MNDLGICFTSIDALLNIATVRIRRPEAKVSQDGKSKHEPPVNLQAAKRRSSNTSKKDKKRDLDAPKGSIIEQLGDYSAGEQRRICGNVPSFRIGDGRLDGKRYCK